MRKLNHALLAGALALACASCTAEKEANYQVIPLPQEVSLTQGNPFKLNENVLIAYPENNALLQRNAEFLSEYIQQATNYAPKTKAIAAGEQVKNAIVLGLDPSIANKEGYVLTTTPEGININGQTENGVFYGIQTLRKSIPAEAKEATILIPAGEIKDEPRFSYRGMHLDVGRHFFPKEFIKKYIDLLALHNMNTFHWHLTEDQGWRIEIKKYPKLTEIGSQRSRTVIGRNTQEYDNTPYGGFYTQEEAKEIVKYAQERYITVIPEVDLPGHMLATLAAYPEMGCTGGPYEVCPRWGIFEDVLCIGNDQTMQFLEDVMNEIIEIFPSKYVHIGGDEAPRTRWEKCQKCQARIKTEGLKADKNHTAEDRLQSYCMTRIEEFLNSKGRQIIGWDEILEGDVAPNATVMSWRGMEGGIKAAQLGHDVIMTPSKWMYIDHGQGAVETEPIAIRFGLPLEKTYSYDPKSPKIPENLRHHVLGAQCNMWTEYAVTPEYTEYLLYPRMLALAELDWTPKEKKDYNSFTRRLDNQLIRLDMHHINYHIPMPEGPMADRIAYTENTTLTFHNSRNYSMVYTTDGSDPQTNSTKYEKPLYLNKDVTVKIATMLPSGKLSPVRSIEVVHEKLMPATEKSTQPGIELRRTEGNLYFVKDLDGAHWSAPKIVKDFEFKPDIEDKGAYCYTGYFEVPADGIYYFSSEMDELRIDGKVIISNDGKLIRHSRTRNSIALQKGKHAFQLLMINNNIGGYLRTWNNKGFILAPEGNELELPKPEKLTH